MKKLFENQWVVLGSIVTTALVDLILGSGMGIVLGIAYIIAAMIYDSKVK